MVTILDSLPFHIDFSELASSLRVRESSAHYQQLQQIAQQAQAIARPKACCQLSFIDAAGEDWVSLDGTRFSSRILRVNLKGVHRVFPYIVTCGVELEEWSNTLDDFLLRFWADHLKEMALRAATLELNKFLQERFQPGALSSMNPGSLGDWPLAAQPALFSLLDHAADTIGVQLTSSYLMLPTKSVSGIYFPTEQHFVSCQLCPRENCPSRRTPYDSTLYESRYAVAQDQASG